MAYRHRLGHDSGASIVHVASDSVKGTGMANRINRAVELLSQGQAIYYTVRIAATC